MDVGASYVNFNYFAHLTLKMFFSLRQIFMEIKFMIFQKIIPVSLNT